MNLPPIKDLIVLLTDFGLSDPYVGIMKGVILSIAPTCRLVDLTHAIQPQNILQAAFLLSATFRDFPEGTIFLCVVDPGVGTSRLPVLVHAFGAFFVGPDNGLFGFLNEDPHKQTLHLTNEKFFRHPISQTFHGRDIFAPVAAHLVYKGPEILPLLGTPISRLRDAPTRLPTITDHGIEGTIVHIDRFGTLISNIHLHHLSPFLEGKIPPKICIGHRELPLVKTFGDVPVGEAGALMGSSSYLEIFIRNGNAEKTLNARLGEKIYVHPYHG